MSIQYTPEELRARKINKRNYSSVLGIIYYLKKLSASPFANPYANVQNFVYSLIGDGAGTAKTFSSVSPASVAKGNAVTLSGTATCTRTLGASTTIVPAISLAAYIDTPAANGNVSQIVFANGTDIDGSGVFSFTIPADITAKLAAGTHSVYIDAQSPKGITRLTGGTDGVRTFTIT